MKTTKMAKKGELESYRIKIDGFDVTFTKKDHIELVDHLYSRMLFWTDTASTFKKAIDLIDAYAQKGGHEK